jgi:hypothetical protein
LATTSPTTTAWPQRPAPSALGALYVGLALTVAATASAYVDRATGHRLAQHLRHGYPEYTSAQISSAVTTWLVVLTVVGALGAVGWVTTIVVVRACRPWARWLAAGLFVAGTVTALTGLLTPDTSGEVGLAPLLGWIGVLPCIAGLTAVVRLWRQA